MVDFGAAWRTVLTIMPLSLKVSEPIIMNDGCGILDIMTGTGLCGTYVRGSIAGCSGWVLSWQTLLATFTYCIVKILIA